MKLVRQYSQNYQWFLVKTAYYYPAEQLRSLSNGSMLSPVKESFPSCLTSNEWHEHLLSTYDIDLLAHILPTEILL